MLCNPNPTPNPTQPQPQPQPLGLGLGLGLVSFISAPWGLDNGYGTMSKTHVHGSAVTKRLQICFVGFTTEILRIWGHVIYRWKGIENIFPAVYNMPPKS
jgi:hypothetical protein